MHRSCHPQWVFARAQVTDYKGNVAPANAFTKVKTLLGSYSCHGLPTSIQHLRESFQAHSLKSTQPRLRAHHRKNRTAKRIGFQTPSILRTTHYVRLYYPSYLHLIQYQKHMFSKDQSLFPTYRKLPIRAAANVICSYRLTNRNFNILCLPLSLLYSRLWISWQHHRRCYSRLCKGLLRYHQTLGCRSHQEFHRSENIISTKWARKIGKGAGVTDGPRNARVFGWSRNLKKKSRSERQNDHDEYERSISAIFSVFYSLLRAQAPPEIIRDLETAMTAAGLPPLDFDNRMQFPLPFLTEKPITFYGRPLSPPEGYIAHNFAKQIHVDKHWTDCPWGAYWNLKRGTPTHQADMEYGANFFISDYELWTPKMFVLFGIFHCCMVRVGIMMTWNNLELLLYWVQQPKRLGRIIRIVLLKGKFRMGLQ